MRRMVTTVSSFCLHTVVRIRVIFQLLIGPSEWPSFCENCTGHKQSPLSVWPKHVEFQPYVTVATAQLSTTNREVLLSVSSLQTLVPTFVPDSNTAYIIVPTPTKPGKMYG